MKNASYNSKISQPWKMNATIHQNPIKMPGKRIDRYHRLAGKMIWLY